MAANHRALISGAPVHHSGGRCDQALYDQLVRRVLTGCLLFVDCAGLGVLEWLLLGHGRNATFMGGLLLVVSLGGTIAGSLIPKPGSRNRLLAAAAGTLGGALATIAGLAFFLFMMTWLFQPSVGLPQP